MGGGKRRKETRKGCSKGSIEEVEGRGKRRAETRKGCSKGRTEDVEGGEKGREKKASTRGKKARISRYGFWKGRA